MRVREGNKEKDILNAAIKIFAESTFHKAKIAKIAELAQVATGSVYLYYKNKEEILRKIFSTVWDELARDVGLINDRKDINPAEKLDAMVDLFFDVFVANPDLAIVFVNEQRSFISDYRHLPASYEKFLQTGEAMIRQGVELKMFNPNLDVRILRYFLLGGIRFLLDLWAKAPNDFSLNHFRVNVKQIIKTGIIIS